MNTNFITWFLFYHPHHILRQTRLALRFLSKLFSLTYLPKHIFDPWHRDSSGYGRGFNISKMLSVLSWNLTSRFVGAVARLIIIGIGLSAYVSALLIGLLFICVWYAAPLILAYLTVSSF